MNQASDGKGDGPSSGRRPEGTFLPRHQLDPVSTSPHLHLRDATLMPVSGVLLTPGASP